MVFFIIVPIWALFVIGGAILLLLPQHRRLGLYAITVSTLATLASIVLSTAVLYFGAKIGPQPNIKWLGFAVIGTYLFSVVAGIALGAAVGFFLTRRILSAHKSAPTSG